VVGKLPDSQEMYVEAKQRILFTLPSKELKVRRLYDAAHDNVVYVSYSTRISSAKDSQAQGQYKTNTCAIHLDPQSTPAADE
jgi:hypothetical protein